MNWGKIKNDITKEKPSSFFVISESEYMERWLQCIGEGWITEDSQITVAGYAVYVLTCLCLNKTSLFGGPLVKSKSASLGINLQEFEIVVMDPHKKEYQLGNNAPGIITVLVRCIEGHGAPRI